MSKFTDALVVTPLADGKTWVLVGAFGYTHRAPGHEMPIDVGAGFMTDFASVPRLLWILLPKWGKYGNPALVHDWRYWRQESFSRSEADRIFLEGMEELGVNRLTKYLMYFAVRAFGWLAWWRNHWDRAAGFDRVIRQEIVRASQTSDRLGVVRRAWQRLRRGNATLQSTKTSS